MSGSLGSIGDLAGAECGLKRRLPLGLSVIRSNGGRRLAHPPRGSAGCKPPVGRGCDLQQRRRRRGRACASSSAPATSSWWSTTPRVTTPWRSCATSRRGPRSCARSATRASPCAGQSAMREHADGGPARHGGGGGDAACHPMSPVLLPEQAAVVTAAVRDAGPLLGARAQPSRVPTCDWAVAREISRSEPAWPRHNALADRRSIRDPSRSRSSAWYAAGFALVRVVQRLLTGRLGRACWCRAAPSWTTCGGYRAP
jgi:hypothetical protein